MFFTNSFLWLIGLVFLIGILLFLTLHYIFNFFIRLVVLLRKLFLFRLFKKITFPGKIILTLFLTKTLSSLLVDPLPPKLILFFRAGLIFFAFIFFIELADALVINYYEIKKKTFPLPRILHGFILTVLYIAFFFIVLRSILNVNLTPFLATSALLTAILGLAFQGVLSNIMTGLSLHFSRSFGRGDWVQIGSFEGIVQEINWRETILLDRQSNLVILPNNVVASEKIINFSRPSKASALVLEVKINYSVKPALIIKKLIEATQEVTGVLTSPSPQAFVAGYDHLGVKYWLKFWIEDFSQKNIILGNVARQVWYKFQREGVSLSFPFNESLKEVLMTIKPERTAAEIRAEREANFTFLLNSDLLRYVEGEKAGELIIPVEEIMALASRVRREIYSQGEVLFRQGERGDCCFLVVRGKLRGEILYEENERQYLSEFEIKEGEIVGEMSLFTGLPRSATVIVAEEAELIRISAADFAQVLEKNPDLSEIIAEVVSQRMQKIQDFLLKVRYLSSQEVKKSSAPGSILERFRQLISLIKEVEEADKKKINWPRKVS